MRPGDDPVRGLSVRDPQLNKLVIGTERMPLARPYGLQSFGSTKDVPFCTDPSSSTNLSTGWRKRLVPVLPKGNPMLYRELELFVKNYLSTHFTPIPNIKYSEHVFNEWLEHTHYDGPRIFSLKQTFSRFSKMNFRFPKTAFNGSTFIKREFYEAPKDVRFINSRSDLFKIYIGPYIKYVEDQVYKDPHFVKGLPIDQLPQKLVKLKQWDYILETDYSSFESSFCYEYVQVVEMQMFKYFFSNNPDILNIILQSYETSPNHQRTQKLNNPNYSLELTGCRLSGEMWTSLGNGFSNLMNMLFLCKNKDIECDGFVEGDDGLFGLSAPLLTNEDFASLGFVIKMEYENQVQNTTFCGNTFSDESMKLLINPENIGRMFWTCAPQYLNARGNRLKDLFRSKAASMYVTGRYTPIAGLLAYNMLQRFGKGNTFSVKGYWRHEIAEYFKKLECVKPVINYHDRVLYSQKFMIPISDQLLIEKFINLNDNDEMNIPYSFMNMSNFEGYHH